MNKVLTVLLTALLALLTQPAGAQTACSVPVFGTQSAFSAQIAYTVPVFGTESAFSRPNCLSRPSFRDAVSTSPFVIQDMESPVVEEGSDVRPDPGTFQWKQLIAPGLLAGTGLAVHFFAHETLDYEIRDRVLTATAGKTLLPIDDYAQYLPVTMHLTLGLMGAECRLGFVDRLIESALAHAVCGVISWPSKQLFHTLRPNGANYQSFPSGHTDFVFTGAELMRMDYGWGWGLAGYGIATGIGFSRIYRNWHWLSDVLFGAGIGIFSAHAGGWLLQPVKDLFGIRTSGPRNAALVPAVDPWSRSATLSFALVF